MKPDPTLLSSSLADAVALAPAGGTDLVRALVDAAVIACGDADLPDGVAEDLAIVRAALTAEGGPLDDVAAVGRRADGLYVRAESGAVQDDGTVVMCTAGEARDGHYLDVSSLKLDNYRDNPVVFYNHAYSEDDCLPIGRILPETIAEGTVGGVAAISGRIEFHRLTEESTNVASLWEAKYLKYVSATWRPSWADGDTIPRRQLPIDHPAYKADGWGMYFKNAEMIELSVVGIPSDTKAKRVRSDTGIRITRRKAAEIADAKVDEVDDGWWK